MTDQKVDCVVVAWHPDPEGRGFGRGFLKVLSDGDPSKRLGLYLRESEILTGSETLHVGSFVRADICPTVPGKSPLALNVEINDEPKGKER